MSSAAAVASAVSPVTRTTGGAGGGTDVPTANAVPVSWLIAGDDVELSENDTHGGVPALNVGPDVGFSVSQVPVDVSYHVIAVPTFGPQTFSVSLEKLLPDDTSTSISDPTVSVDGGGLGVEVSWDTVTAPSPVAFAWTTTPVVGFVLSTVPVDPVDEDEEPVDTSVDVDGAGGGVVGGGGEVRGPTVTVNAGLDADAPKSVEPGYDAVIECCPVAA